MNHARRRPVRLLALLLSLALVAGACGGKKGGKEVTDEIGDPERGGSITYALEAETGDGWCLPESQLAISGIVVARAIYDTLTAPNADGEYVPYLAEAVTPSEDYKTWTIKLRDGVEFHDGSPLTAEVVKNNIDAWRGVYPNRPKVLLLRFVFENINTVEVTGDLEVTVTTKVPWVAFPAFLYSSGRTGIVGQAQLDDADACDTNLIGTGPFKKKSWTRDQEFVAVANPKYWQTAPDGKPYPYLEEIKFVPVIEAEQRVNALQAGTYDLIHGSGAPEFVNLREMKKNGEVRTYESEESAEVSFVQMNASKPPMNDDRVRRAAALAVDPEDYTERINEGLFTMANGPFAPGSIGYTEDTGYPAAQDLEEAKRLIAEYEAENGQIKITYQATPGAQTQRVALYVQQRMKDIGAEVTLQTVQQDQLIDNAIGGDFDIMGFRNYPGGDPDELYVWFKGGSPVNFSRFSDPEIDRLLDEGRSETDPAAREQIYQDINKRFGEKIWYIWANWTTWIVAGQPGVHGYDPDTVPELPDGSAPDAGLATGHPLLGLWVEAG